MRIFRGVLPSQLAYAQRTTAVSVTATSAAGATDLGLDSGTVTYDGTAIRVEFFTHQLVKGTSSITIVLYDGSTQLGNIGLFTASGSVALMATEFTPSAGAHDYKLKAFVDGGTGTVQAGDGTAGNMVPAYIRVTRA